MRKKNRVPFKDMVTPYLPGEIDPEGLIRDPFQFVGAVIRRLNRYGGEMTERVARCDYQELVHEGVVALWSFLHEAGNQPGEGYVLQAWLAVLRHLARFVYSQTGKSGEIPFSQFGTEESEPIEFGFDPDVAGQVEQSLTIEGIKKLAERVLRQNRRRVIDGERDVQVFNLFASGLDPEDLSKHCPWLKNTASADEAVLRCILKLRQELGIDASLPIRLARNARQISGERFNSAVYYQKWYAENADRLRQKNRERQKQKRATEKANRLLGM